MRFVYASLLCLNVFAASPAQLLEKAPIRFEPNQSDWVARGRGYAFRFTEDATLMRIADRTIKLTLDGANRHTRLEGMERMHADSNYFFGKQYASVPAFQRLRRAQAYPGIDVVYYGNGREMEYDFEVAAGADPSRIRMRFDGMDAVRLNSGGEIALALGSSEIVQRVPVVYQRTGANQIVAVEAAYRLAADGTVRLSLGAYNPTIALVVDPTITYSVYLDGSGWDTTVALAHDASGFVYLAGNTYSIAMPVTTDAYQSAQDGGYDMWVMKVNQKATTSGEIIVYCSYLGGGSDDLVKGMAIDPAGVIYLTGSTASFQFPTTTGAYQSLLPSGTTTAHAFVSVIDPSQSGSAGLIYSTYLSGVAGTNIDDGDGIAVAGGKVYVTGYTNSADFPITSGQIQTTLTGSYDAFVVELDTSQTGAQSFITGTYLGGSGQDAGRTIAVDAQGHVWVGGFTYSFDFPVTGNAVQPGYNTEGDAFVAELDLAKVTLAYSTYLGGSSQDEVTKIVTEPTGRVGVAGYTLSPDFPVTQNAVQTKFGGNGNAFLTIIDPTLVGALGMVYSTLYGGTGGEVPYDLRRDSAGKYYFGGYTFSFDLPVTSNALNGASAGAGMDGFVAIIDPFESGLFYSSYVTGPGTTEVNGVDVDSAGKIFVTGTTTSNIYPSNGYPQRSADLGIPDPFLLIFKLQ